MKVMICGIPHKVIETEDSFDCDTHLGQIDYKDATIKINKNMDQEIKRSTLCHEIVHGMFEHLGYSDIANNETLVTALGNMINMSFTVKEIE